MIVSYNWLKEFVDIDVEPRQLARTLVAAGLEVDSITQRAIPAGIVSARVNTVDKHPNADKLHICSVDTGSDTLQVVCGAPNVRPGLLVACATVGTDLGDGFVIKKAKLRGVESMGMLCSERELRISSEHAGIMELPDTVNVGQPLSSLFPDDTLFELEITPDRGDCLSILGVAREVACAFRKPLMSMVKIPQESGESVAGAISVAIDDPERCPRYMGRLITGVKPGPSPLWLRDHLASAGIRSINTIVDITNYVLIAFGQPMHAFDYARLAGKQIRVRTAHSDEQFTTLDGITRTLKATDLLICDNERGVALAGVMGGQNSEICDSTTDVFLECAYFDPPGIRVTSRRLGLSSDSSYRFERGVDPAQGLEDALDTAAELLRTLAGGTVAKGRIDICPEPLHPRTVVLRPERARKLLGVAVETGFMIDSLNSLGMRCIAQDESLLEFSVPLFRHDIAIEVDLIEEIGRLYGYDTIPVREFCRVPVEGRRSVAEQKAQRIRQALAFAGLNEVVTNSMTSEKSRAATTPGVSAVALLNPLNPDMAQLRTSLVSSHLVTIAYNVNRRIKDCRIFEIGKTFTATAGEKLPRERTFAAITLTGDFFTAGWNSPAQASSVELLKGIIDNLSRTARLGRFETTAVDTNAAPWLDTEGASLRSDNHVSGSFGRVKASVAKVFDIDQPVFHAALDITDFLVAEPGSVQYSQVTKYPSLERDFCFVMPENFISGTIEKEILSLSDLVQSVRPFDVYRGENLGGGKKSIAYSVRLESPERTLTDTDSNTICSAIVSTMQNKYGITLRA